MIISGGRGGRSRMSDADTLSEKTESEGGRLT